ncbi:MAG: hypothetical protein IKJ78_04390 [Bacteroidales bacterium]|nr:hypothetical protein [Bacteroidales bacterium]
MSNKVIFIAFATLMAMSGCKQTPEKAKAVSLDRDNNDKIEYVIDYTVRFAADHDSTMQLTVSGNRGSVRVAQVESENLIGEYGKPVKNTFIILEDSVPAGKSITLHRGGLSYAGGKPEFIHNNTIGSDDMVELRILDTNALTHSHTNALTHSSTLYSIRDNMFFGPEDQQSITIPGSHRFSVVLPIITEEMYPKSTENHSIRIVFEK